MPAFPSIVNLRGLPVAAGFKVQGDASNDRLGRTVSSAGDINGDGYDDIIVNAADNDAAGSQAGAAYVIFGRPGVVAATIDTATLSASDGFKIQGALAGDYAGISVSAAGDFNNDGFDDVLVGAFRNDSGGNNAGAAYVIYGKASGFGALVNLATLTAADGVRIQGDAAGNQAGSSVARAGDVNGDGIDDILVAANGFGSYTGTAYVLYGKSGGHGALIDLTGLGAADGFRIVAEAAGNGLPNSIASAGDINGDGIDDIVLGSRFASSAAGAAYVLFGKQGGFGATLNLAGLAAADGFKVTGEAASDFAGASVGSAGDINGDGFDDLVIGAYGNDYGGNSAGASYVIFGKATGFGTGFALTNLTADIGFKIIGDTAQDTSGRSVSSAGDINGDGIADLLIGAQGQDGGAPGAGAAYVIYGKTGGFGLSVDLRGLSPFTGFKVVGDNVDDSAGYSVAAAGDVNGDGFDDIVISAPGHDSGGGSAGAVYVVFGRPIPPNTPPTGTDATFNIYTGFPLKLTVASFGLADTDPIAADTMLSITITSISGSGTLSFDADGNGPGAGVAVTVGQTFTIADVAARKLSYLASSGTPGAGYGSISFQARDDGGTENGGVDTDPTPNTLTFDLIPLFQPPATLPGVVNLGALGTNGFKIVGAATIDRAGFVSGAGDINDDGFDDIVVGAPNADPVGTDANSGVAYVLYGKGGGFAPLVNLGALPTQDGFAVQGPQSLGLGVSVAGGGDVNGDGFADIIAQAYGLGSEQSADNYIILGRADAFAPLVTTAPFPTTTGFRLVAPVAGGRPNNIVSSAGVVDIAGDVNGDGVDDIIFSAPQDDSGGLNAGAAYVVFGRASGFGLGFLVDSSLPAAFGFRIQGDLAGNQLRAVAGAGDINADGFDDIIVGSSLSNSGGTSSGAAYVIYGKATGFGTLIDLSTLSVGTGFTILGAPRTAAGFSVSSAGDVNGDGFADMIVGATSSVAGETDGGSAYVIFGKAAGFAATIDLANLSAADGFRLRGAADSDRTGQAVSSAGDFNGDGFGDLLIGASRGNGGTGVAYLLFGKAGAFGATVDLATLSATDGVRFNGEAATDSAGYNLSAAGDINGDGFDDIIIGALNHDAGAVDTGAAYVIFGRPTASSVSPAVADVATTGEASPVSIAVLANDTDPPEGPRAVSQVAGVTATVGTPITLPSGATATLQANGTITYSPNGKFAYLVSSATAAGNPAFAAQATDSFTYALNGGSSATVTVTVTGADGPGDELRGNTGANTITGTPGNDLINLSQGGSDTVSGGAGNDGVYLGGAFDAGDRIDGGAGVLDQIGLQGDYSTQLVLGANTMANVEMLVLLPGSDTRFGAPGTGTTSYNIRTNDANVAAGQTLAVQANTLRGAEGLTFDGSAETDGSFTFYGGLGADVLIGGQGNDGFFFGQDRFGLNDRVDGQGGTMDQIGLQGDFAGARAVAFGANQMTGIEMIVLLSGADTRFGGGGAAFSYNLRMNDGNVAAGQTMVVQGNRLGAGEVLTLDASAETNGRYRVFGGAAADQILGGAGNDEIWGGRGSDFIRGGGGNDVFAYQSAADSPNPAERDTIRDFASGDVIDVARVGLSTFIGSAPFTAPGQLRVVGAGFFWQVLGDVDGDGAADLTISVEVVSPYAWSAADFRLATPVADVPGLIA